MLANISFWLSKLLYQKKTCYKNCFNEKFEYFPLAKEWRAQTDISKKKYQGLNKAFISNKDNENVNESLIKKENETYNKSNLIYSWLSLYSYCDDKNFDSLSFRSKYSYQLSFYDDLQRLIKMEPIKLVKIKEKENVYKTVHKLCNKRFENNKYK